MAEYEKGWAARAAQVKMTQLKKRMKLEPSSALN